VIAEAAGVADPLDARVVEAYWIGNDLLGAVDPDTFRKVVRERFASQLSDAAAARLASMPPDLAVAHHSFHVFTIYPWTAMLGGPRRDIALSVLDRCRIRWGIVTGSDGPRAHVRSRPLRWDGGRMRLGTPRTESVRWSSGDRPSSGQAPAPGSVVSCHWDWVCDRLTPAQVTHLATRTAEQLTAIRTA
jgi:hypothetical protein